MSLRRSALAIGFVLLIAMPAAAQLAGTEPGTNPGVFKKAIAKELACQYLLFLPKEYGKEDKKWPLMVFLHGAGERGNDLNQVKVHGPIKVAERWESEGKQFPVIILGPQCPRGRGFGDQWWDVEIVAHLVDEIIFNYPIDKKRVYLTGLSMGGFGTFELAAYRPDLFAAIAPISGGGVMLQGWKLARMPIWAFHGAKDDRVPVEESKRMIDLLGRRNRDAKLTIYPEAEHDAWTETYDNPELYEWFLQHSKD